MFRYRDMLSLPLVLIHQLTEYAYHSPELQAQGNLQDHSTDFQNLDIYKSEPLLTSLLMHFLSRSFKYR